MSKPQEITDASFQSEVLDSDQPVLGDFWAAWCGPCRLVGPTINELAEQYEGTVKVAKLNVDENQQTPGRFGINSIPAVLLFVDGKVVETFVGVQSKQRYQQALDYLYSFIDYETMHQPRDAAGYDLRRMDELLERYNASIIINVRLKRMVNKNQIVLRDGRYYIGKPIMLYMAKAVVMMKLFLLGKKSEFN